MVVEFIFSFIRKRAAGRVPTELIDG